MSKCLLQNKRHCVNNYKYFVFYFKYQIIPIYDINSRCGGHIYCRFETFHRLIKKESKQSGISFEGNMFPQADFTTGSRCSPR